MPQSLESDIGWAIGVPIRPEPVFPYETGMAEKEKIMSVQASITAKLTEAFAPASLDVIDESHHHQGHGGWREGGETHFRVKVVSEAFRGRSRVDRHRMVNQVLDAELKGRVHALAIEARAPGE
jgi:BolA protein